VLGNSVKENIWTSGGGSGGRLDRTANKERHNLFASRNIIRVIKSRMRWFGHVAGMGRWEMHTKFWSEKLKWRGHLEEFNVCGKWCEVGS